MSRARDLVLAERGSWRGRYGSCPGPVEFGHSGRGSEVSAWDRPDGSVGLKYWPDPERWAELRDLYRSRGHDLGDDYDPTGPRRPRREPTPEERAERERQIAAAAAAAAEQRAEMLASARKRWRESTAIKGTLAEVYLRWRGIVLDPLPGSLRFHPALLHPSEHVGPALVAGKQALDGAFAGFHRTWLEPDGRGKHAGLTAAKSVKMALGQAPGGGEAVRLAPAGETLALAEGVETGLSFMQITGLPTWCACGSHLSAVALPTCVRRVVVAADNGAAGEKAAQKGFLAFSAFLAGRGECEIWFPPGDVEDWNDTAGREREGDRR